MEYMSCPEVAKKWGVSDRRVQKLCEENRIKGVSHVGNIWLIPKEAERWTQKGGEEQEINRAKKYFSTKPDIYVGDKVCHDSYNYDS